MEKDQNDMDRQKNTKDAQRIARQNRQGIKAKTWQGGKQKR